AVVLERAGLGPETLPDPSRRAYQWLSYLGEEQALQEHVLTLRQAMRVDPRPRIEITHLPGLYRGLTHADDVRLSISEGFLMAPPAVIAGLVKIVLPYSRKKQHRAVVHAYAESPAFRQRLRAVEQAGGAVPPPRTAGRTHNLESIFQTVNREYFDGRLVMPVIQWNPISTLREFGRFEPATETIVLSRRLDAPDVPEQVVAYVLYHELLHRVLGAKREGSRRRFHTPAFRKAERRFRGHEQAEQFLQSLSHRGRQYGLTVRVD
ncbi:MAG: SprT-like domain-containing protein, partial [Anaerolineales bacterium]|nr:SprT-like domain-containing protein [Anaerolineales bacterium]